MRQDFGDLRGVQIFRRGHWAGLDFDDAALDAMVANYHALKDVVAPRLKVGHDDVDGAPALGYITDLKKVGEFLEADFSDVPDSVLAAIQAGAYRDVSIEAYPKLEATNLERNLKTGRLGPLITACAILGSQIPEVKGLRPLPRLAAAEDEPTAIRVTFAAQPRPTLHAGALPHPRNEAPMPDDTKPETPAKQSAKSAQEITKLSEQLAAEQAERATLNAEVVKLREEAAATATLKTQHDAEIKRLSEANTRAEQRAREMAADAFVAEFSNADNLRVLPAERAFVKAAYLRLTAATDEIVVLSEGKEEKLNGEAFLRTWLGHRPDRKALLSTMSEATKPETRGEDTFETATLAVAKDRQLDMSKETWKRDASVILCTEEPYKTKYAALLPSQGQQTTH